MLSVCLIKVQLKGEVRYFKKKHIKIAKSIDFIDFFSLKSFKNRSKFQLFLISIIGVFP